MSKIADAFLERPLWQRVAFWIGSLLFVAYCSYQFVLASSIEEHDALVEKIEGLNKSIAQEKRIARDLNKFRQEVRDLEVQLKFALQELPDKREIADLLTSISNLARDAGLVVNLFKTVPENFREFYAEVPVQISVEGSYHQTVSFFDEVRRLPRIINISQISMRSPKMRDGGMAVTTDCLATTFTYLDEAERAKLPKADDATKRKKR
jgi:type IV pilus assembly protein PilO